MAEIHEQCLGALSQDVIKESVMASPGCDHVSWTVKRGMEQAVVIDGAERLPCDGILRDTPVFNLQGTHWAYGALVSARWRLISTLPEASVDFQSVADGSVTFSPNGERISCVAREGREWFAVIDGEEGEHYDAVGERVRFSPDSRRTAYVAVRGPRWTAVVDGISSSWYDEVIYGPFFSRDSKTSCYVAKRSGRAFAVVGNEESTPYTGIHSPRFLLDSHAVGYVVLSGDGESVVVDGVEQARYDEVSKEGLILCPGGNHMAYAAKNGAAWCAVLDGEEQRSFDRVKGLTFSRDGEHFAYIAKNQGEEFVVVDGVSGRPFPGIFPDSLAFSPDGAKLAYLATSGQQYRFIVNEKECGDFEDYVRWALSPVFSPDSRDVAFLGKRGGKWAVVLNGELLAAFDGIPYLSKLTLADDFHLRLLTYRGQDVIRVTVSLPK